MPERYLLNGDRLVPLRAGERQVANRPASSEGAGGKEAASEGAATEGIEGPAVSPEGAGDPYCQFVELFSADEFNVESLPYIPASIGDRMVAHAMASHSEAFADCSIGVVVRPDRSDLLHNSFTMRFFIDDRHLVLVDDSDVCSHFLKTLAHQKKRRAPLTLGRTLFLLLEELIKEDAEFLEEFEQRIERVEEQLMSMDQNDATRIINLVSRELLRLGYYYEQMEDTGELLLSNENDLLEDHDANLYGLFSRHANRLYDRTRALKEYAIQLFDLQQNQLDVRQNETMKVLTVVTSIFVPLTLLTSWYGMNFQYMPELASPIAYPLVLVACVVIVVAEIAYMRHRNWF